MRITNKNLIILAAICLALGMATRIANNLAPGDPYALNAREKAMIGSPAPQFSFRTMDGTAHRLSDFEGRAVILNFWATWCPPCVVEFPQLLNLARETHDQAVYIFISSDIERSAIERFMTRLRTTHADELAQDNVLIVWDADKSITQTLFQTYRLPETYLLAPSLVITEKIVGANVIWDGEAMIGKIQALAQN